MAWLKHFQGLDFWCELPGKIMIHAPVPLRSGRESEKKATRTCRPVGSRGVSDEAARSSMCCGVESMLLGLQSCSAGRLKYRLIRRLQANIDFVIFQSKLLFTVAMALPLWGFELIQVLGQVAAGFDPDVLQCLLQQLTRIPAQVRLIEEYHTISHCRLLFEAGQLCEVLGKNSGEAGGGGAAIRIDGKELPGAFQRTQLRAQPTPRFTHTQRTKRASGRRAASGATQEANAAFFDRKRRPGGAQ